MESDSKLATYADSNHKYSTLPHNYSNIDYNSYDYRTSNTSHQLSRVDDTTLVKNSHSLAHVSANGNNLTKLNYSNGPVCPNQTMETPAWQRNTPALNVENSFVGPLHSTPQPNTVQGMTHQKLRNSGTVVSVNEVEAVSQPEPHSLLSSSTDSGYEQGLAHEHQADHRSHHPQGITLRLLVLLSSLLL